MDLKKRIAVNSRIMCRLKWLSDLTLQPEEVLKNLGFRIELITPMSVARACIGMPYSRGANSKEWGKKFDCSSLTKFCYAQMGYWIPRRSIQQFSYGHKPTDGIRPGDLVFVKGKVPYWSKEMPDGIGHVGIFIGRNQVIEAADKQSGVIISPLEKFTASPDYRGTIRMIDNMEGVVTLFIPHEWIDVETIDDLRWLITSQL